MAKTQVVDKDPTQAAIQNPERQKRLSEGQGRVSCNTWPSGPFDHRDKEP
jgi:hypothetical protein